MHRLIEQAKASIRKWPSDEPRDLARAVATLCSEVLDDNGLPPGKDWMRLRQSFDVVKGESIASTIAEWHGRCRHGNFGLSDEDATEDAFVKLGIVTWTVTKLLKKLHMLTGPPAPDMSLEEWKSSLVQCLDRYIISGRQETTP
jgi:hypothetical protein